MGERHNLKVTTKKQSDNPKGEALSRASNAVAKEKKKKEKEKEGEGLP